MLRQPRRLLSAGIAIILGVTFITVALLLGSSLDQSVRDMAAGKVGDASVAVDSAQDEGEQQDPADAQRVSDQVVEDLAAQPGVTGTRAIITGYAWTLDEGAQAQLLIQNQPPMTERTKLTRGRPAAADDELTSNTVMSSALGLEPGDDVVLHGAWGGERSFRVVGIIDAGPDAVSSTKEPFAFGTDAAVMAVAGYEGYDTVMAYGGDPQALKSSVSQLDSVESIGAEVRTGAEEIRHQVDQLGAGASSIKNAVLAFGVISLFVSLMVIANTFSILVSQRSRQLALMRCVGATRGQVFATVIGEALALGAVGSAVGVLVGYGLSRLLLSLGQNPLTTPVVFAASAAALIAPFIAGVIVTLLSSIGAARRATAVAPLAALHPELAAREVKSLGPVRAVVGMLLAAAGGALLVYGWRTSGGSDTGGALRTLLTVMAGAATSFLGVLVLGRGIIPALARVIGAPLRRSGVSGELAVSNSRRDPGRAAATANALLVGVTLISSLTIGAATSQSTIDRALSDQYPLDASIRTEQGVDQTVLERIRSVDGVTGAALVPSAQMRATADGANAEITTIGVSGEAARVSRASHTPRVESDDQILIGGKDFHDGQRVVLHDGDASMELTARIDDSLQDTAVVAPDVLAALAPDASNGVWARYADNADASRVTRDIGRIDGLQGAEITSGAVARGKYQQIIDVVLIVATALLAVAVIIAVIGVGNTLSLSVLERTRELGLLRALGMTRGQVRSMVAWESVTLAAVATVIGLALGAVYGIIGCKGMIASNVTLVVSIPWARIVLIAGVAMLAGWLASLAPAARAVKVAPSAALAAE